MSQARRAASARLSPGISRYLSFKEMPLELAEQLTRVNWLGTVYTVKAVLPGMLARGRGHIVVVSSGAGLRAFPHARITPAQPASSPKAPRRRSSHSP